MSDENPAQAALQQVLKHIEKNKQAGQSNPEFQQFPDNFKDLCQAWAQRDIWTLDEATNLFCGTSPDRPFAVEGHDELNLVIKRMRDILSRADVGFEGTLNKKAKAKDLLDWAIDKQLDIPEEIIFAMGKGTEAKPATEKLRPNQIHKQLCQAVAKTLWDVYPDMTIKAMMEHKAIQEYGGGAYYSPDKTLRKWLSEIDPRPKDQKVGRPRSK